jgi:pimeloyl-ACP methyl ester carboxylesterase
MINLSEIDCSALDRPEVTNFLFHPRPEVATMASSTEHDDIKIPVDEGIEVGAKFHIADESYPCILFFHGNGEIVSDYDDMAPLYNSMDINFLPVDYRGYGRSNGTPGVTSMLRDAHKIFMFTEEWLKQKGVSGPLFIMGRSLGSASALEIAVSYQDQIAGLVIESGFAYSLPLMRLLGIDVGKFGITEDDCMGNLEKMKNIKKPTRVIHAEFDHIIPYADGVALFDACPDKDKEMVKIEGADHNSIFYHGREIYMQTLKKFLHGDNLPG